MTSRFEKFSERARRVLSLAQEEAKRFNHNHIDTEPVSYTHLTLPTSDLV